MNDRLISRVRDVAGKMQLSMVEELPAGTVAEVDGVYRVSLLSHAACDACFTKHSRFRETMEPSLLPESFPVPTLSIPNTHKYTLTPTPLTAD